MGFAWIACFFSRLFLFRRRNAATSFQLDSSSLMDPESVGSPKALDNNPSLALVEGADFSRKFVGQPGFDAAV